MNYTEDQLKAALVRALPERLGVSTTDSSVAMWKDTWECVTPHEWPAIVGMVEDTLTDEQQDYFIRELQTKTTDWIKDPEDERWLNRLLFTKWPTRAQALVEIGVLTVKD